METAVSISRAHTPEGNPFNGLRLQIRNCYNCKSLKENTSRLLFFR
jgi:hypothetical protein